MEEESFELLSSMSPKVKHYQKHLRKGTTVLALRKSIRRSSIYDKSIHTITNDKLAVTEVSSTCTSESSAKSFKSNNLLSKTPIVISDSDNDSNENETSLYNELDKDSVKCTDDNGRSLLSVDKFENIKHWIDTVNIQNELKDNSVYSTYSELSSIQGDENCKNFVTERRGRAVSSTFIQSSSIDFDKLFKRKTDSLKKSKDNNDIIIDKSSQGSLVNSPNINVDVWSIRNKTSKLDVSSLKSNSVASTSSSKSNGQLSLENKNCSKNMNNSNKGLSSVQSKLHTKGKKSDSDSSIESDSDNSYTLNVSLKTRLKSKKFTKKTTINCEDTSKENTKEIGNINDREIASMLDDLYGDSWREKEEHVLPKSEPRKQIYKINNDRIISTERKPKFSVLYKNSYLETEKLKPDNLLKSLQKSNLRNDVLKQLNNLCDSDTDSESRTEPRKKLIFDDSDEDIYVSAKQKTTSKYFNTDKIFSNNKNLPLNDSDKENFDKNSYLGVTLEDKIQRKINRVKDIRKTNKKNKKVLKVDIAVTKKNDLYFNETDNNVPTSEKKKVTSDKKGSTNSEFSDDEWDKEISRIVQASKPSNGQYSFLASLSPNVPILQCDMSARIFRNNFTLYKDELLKKLFTLYNEKIFDNAIPPDTLLQWNDRMRGTAGFCYCRKITRKTGAVERTVRIVLSTKVIDAAYRLRDTLIHEMCHAATWIVNCISDGHGSFWKSWARKAMKTFPELPPIKRCHDYVVNTKYTYKCVGCGYSIGRHSKSLDIERKRCGYCLGKFEILLNKVSKKGEIKSVPATPKKEATGFALFVKQNYSAYKQAHLKHGEVMKLLGQKFQEIKLKQN